MQLDLLSLDNRNRLCVQGIIEEEGVDGLELIATDTEDQTTAGVVLSRHNVAALHALLGEYLKDLQP